MVNERIVVFDLDGTLVDSAPSILTSVQAAFDKAGITPARDLTSALIGPPLMEMLDSLLPEGQVGQKETIGRLFREHYDAFGCLEALPYPGVDAMLQTLRQRSMRLLIATNKRLSPAQRIVVHQGWNHLFEGVRSLDFFVPPVRSKSEMLRRIRAELGDAATGALYVGDRREDAEAARDSGLPFIFADWGYGGVHRFDGIPRARQPSELISCIDTLWSSNNNHLLSPLR